MDNDLWYQLPPDMNTWPNMVIENIARKIPEIPQYIQSISWDKFDPTQGSADGLLYLLNGMAAAPITIRGNKLAPVDVMVTKSSKFFPLTPLFLQKVFADNVIAEPSNDPTYDSDNVSDGPGRKIKHFHTVDAVKRASIESVKHLRQEIEKDANVANFMVEKMPEALEAILDRSEADPALEKKASVDVPLLQVIWKDTDGFHFNNDTVPVEDVADFCKTAGISVSQKKELMRGKPIVVDYRAKTAALTIPDELAIKARLDAKAITEGASAPLPVDLCVTSAVLRDGRVIPGIVFVTEYPTYEFIGKKPNEDGAGSGQYYGDIQEVFVSAAGYGKLLGQIKTTSRTACTVEDIKAASQISEPHLNMLCVALSASNRVKGPFVIKDVTMYPGGKTHVIGYNMATQEDTPLDDYSLYEIVDNVLPVMKDTEEAPTEVFSGVNVNISTDSEGNLVMDGEKKSLINCAYAMMDKYAARFDDAMAVAKIAKELGSCSFYVKEAADDKKTKSGTDDEEKKQALGQQLDSPVSLFQPDLAGSNTEGGQQQQQAVAQQPVPVNAEDLANITKLNEPNLMDSYLSSSLAASNLSGQETIAQASNSITEALSQISKLLFLVRQGAITYVSEADAQVAMNKLSDVAQSLGINTTQAI